MRPFGPYLTWVPYAAARMSAGTDHDRQVPTVNPLSGAGDVPSTRMAARVFEATSDAIFVTDPDGLILDVNPAFEAVTGYTRDEVIGQTPSMMKSGVHDAEFFRRMWHTLKTVGRWRGEVWDRHKSGEIFPKWSTISAIRDDSGRITHYVTVFNDISEVKRNERELRRQAHYDPLTDLPNRNLFMDRLEQAIEHGRRTGRMSALMFMDLDRFKEVNDSLGHRGGDLLLIEAGQRLRECVRTDDTIARLSGDEFTILLHEVRAFSDGARVAGKIMDAMSRPFVLEGGVASVSASIGITVCPVDGDDPQTLLANADAAMYHAKRQGRATFRFFAATMNEESLERAQLESGLRGAADRDELDQHFQPIVDLSCDRVVGAEALIRWFHPFSGVVPPELFMPIAEESGQIVPMGRWALRTACMQASAWTAKASRPLFVTLDLSPKQFRTPGLVATIRDALDEANLPPEQLGLALGPAGLAEIGDRAVPIARELAATGVRLILDGFGEGRTPLNLACQLPITSLRLGRRLTAALPHRPDNVRIVSAILAMAGSLGLDVVAQGVETPAALAHLREEGVRLVQGGALGIPTAADEFARRHLQKGRPDTVG